MSLVVTLVSLEHHRSASADGTALRASAVL